MRPLAGIIGLVLVASACSSGDSSRGDSSLVAPIDDPTALVTSEGFVLPDPPDVPTGPTETALIADLDDLFTLLDSGLLLSEHIVALADHEDLRVGWVLADLTRFVTTQEAAVAIAEAFELLTGIDLSAPEGGTSIWKSINDHMIAWDVPAFDEYATYKERLFTRFEPGWARFFADPGSLIDWRFVTWGGVFIDDRELGAEVGCARGCIPALDDPAVTSAADGDWYPDDSIVFGVVVEGEARAYPKNIMEVHEMINDTLGGRRIGMPYCTLCGSAQAYFTDMVPDGVETPILRTSGLLSRSNKIMYDLVTGSVFDTFTGMALSGPLREESVTLEQTTVITSSWAAWKESHPDTTIVAEDGGIGRTYSPDPLGGRDDDGPIFPVGDVDGRLAVQEPVIGVIAPDGTPIAFPAVTARLALERGEPVSARGVTLALDGDGLRGRADDGGEVAAHQAFWFAWSQFHPDTEVWVTS